MADSAKVYLRKAMKARLAADCLNDDNTPVVKTFLVYQGLFFTRRFCFNIHRYNTKANQLTTKRPTPSLRFTLRHMAWLRMTTNLTRLWRLLKRFNSAYKGSLIPLAYFQYCAATLNAKR